MPSVRPAVCSTAWPISCAATLSFVVAREVLVYQYAIYGSSVGSELYQEPSRIFLNLSRRNPHNTIASDRLCDGVKFRWREGFISSAQRASADNSSGDKRSAFASAATRPAASA